MLNLKFIKMTLILGCIFWNQTYATNTSSSIIEIKENTSSPSHPQSLPLSSQVISIDPRPTEVTALLPTRSAATTAPSTSVSEHFEIPVLPSDSTRLQNLARSLNSCYRGYNIVTSCLYEISVGPALFISGIAGIGVTCSASLSSITGFDSNSINLILGPLGTISSVIAIKAHQEALRRATA